jgi:DNA repair protein RadC
MNAPLSPQEKIQLLNTEDLYGVMQQMLLREEQIRTQLVFSEPKAQEHFWVVGLSDQYNILFIELIYSGDLAAKAIEPMEVFSLALQKRAAHLVLYHNYPDGQLMPSEADKDITDRLIQVGLIVNTPILDHQIISTQDYLSFQDIGLMVVLQKSLKYVPSFEAAKRIREEAAAVLEKRDAEYKEIIASIEQELKQEKKRAEKAELQLQQEKTFTAQKMKEKGIALALIAEITGLSIDKLKQL